MGHFRKIDPRIWNDENFRTLSRDEMLIAFYVLTAQSNRIGFFNFSPAKAAEDLGMKLESFAEALPKLCRSLKWSWDKASRTIYIPTWWKYNLPLNPNVLSACLKDIDSLPQSPLAIEFWNNTLYLPESFTPIFAEASRKALANLRPLETTPETTLEKEREQESKPRSKPSEETSESFLKFWESYPHSRRTGKPQCRKIWKVKNLDVQIETILSALENHKTSNDWQKEGGQYIPGSAVWLNQERWEQKMDVVTPQPIQSKSPPLVSTPQKRVIGQDDPELVAFLKRKAEREERERNEKA